MKEELQTQLISSLDKVQEYIEASEGFILEQAPLVAQEIVLSGRIQYGAIIVGLTVILIPLYTAILTCLFKYWRKSEEDGFLCASAIIGIIAMFPTAFMFDAVHRGIIPFFAPRLYLLREISDLL